jgi:NADH dehydrogenase
VVDLPKYHFNGVFAWFVWMFVHLFRLWFQRTKPLYSVGLRYIRLIVRKLIIRPYKRKALLLFMSDRLILTSKYL